MGRDYSNYERHERRRFGGTDDWSAEIEEGIDPYARDRVTRRSGWAGSPVTSYREADPREMRDAGRDDWDRDDRDRRRPVNRSRDWGDERRQPSHGYDLDHDVYRAGDRDEWRGEFGPKEDRTQWDRGPERDWRGTMRGASRDRYRSLRESGDDPYREQRYGRDIDWSRDTDFGRRTDYPRREDDRPIRGGSSMRRSAGQFSGRGQRGYQRSDERIREDICEILWEHGEVDASELDVMVENGEVTLEGTVDSRWTKRMAEDAAHDVRGVHDVHNRLRVRREQTGWDRGSDTMTRTGYRTDQQRSTTGNVMMEGGRTATGPAFAPDMTVVGADGDEVGIVKEVREHTILVDRPMARDVYIPYSAVRVTDGSTARLSIDSGDVDNQGWQNPPMTGTDTDYDESVQLT